MSTHALDRTRLPERNLDVLRAVAVLLVLADHVFSAIGHDNRGWNWNWALGRLGVLLFFVHTSLVLMSSLERGGFAKGWVPRFYLRRAFRIYPLAIVVVLIAALFRLPSHVTADGSDMLRAFPSLGTLGSNLLLVQNLTGARDIQGVLWSLPLEVQMYVLLPLCFSLARRGAATMIAQVLTFLALGLLLQSRLVETVPGLWRLSVFTFGPCFISGVLAYHLLRRASVPRAPSWTWPLAILFIAAFFALLRPTSEHPDLGWWPCITLAFLIPLVAEMRASWTTSAAHEVAKYSYGIYLAHVPILWLWLRAIPALPTPVRWLGVAVSLFVVPVVLFRTIEDPMIRYGRTIARRLSLENAPEPPVASEVGAP
ncbi:MAG: acyltransferase [Gemmatimonadaceae bacterium]